MIAIFGNLMSDKGDSRSRHRRSIILPCEPYRESKDSTVLTKVKKPMNDLVAAFNEYFDIIRATTPELVEEVYRLRYKVLCIEKRFPGFDEAKYPYSLEKDNYDYRSVHILIRHKASNTYVGTARLILADPSDLEKPFPVEAHTKLTPASPITEPARVQIAEISRLLILSKFPHHRTPRGRTYDGNSLKSLRKQPRFHYPILALVLGIIRMSAEHNITHWYGILEPTLNRLLGRFGLDLKPIGPIIDYYGTCQPHFSSIQDVLEKAYSHHYEAWRLVTDQGQLWRKPVRQSRILIKEKVLYPVNDRVDRKCQLELHFNN